ncbi:hypothetical protein FOFC_10233 [Fusarium oxysporum]|nr:hypothetical protein FOFC_10233 [Fusarium oxysporum]
MAGSDDLEANNRMSRGSEAVDNGFSEKPLNQGTGSRIHASVYIITWIFFSNTTILFNKWLIDTAGFRKISKTFGNIMLIVAGVAISSFGEIEFSWWGFIFQMCGTIAEAVRVVMIQVMLSAEGLRMDPLVGLYYYAPVCTLMNMVVVLFSEGPRFKWEDAAQAGYGVLLANACLAFFLNVISVFLIGKTSGLVMTLSGILKSILLVAASVVLWGTHISLTQTLGYAVALMGLVLYSIGYEQLLNMWEEAVAWGTGTLNREGEMSPTLRKAIMIGCLGFITVIIAGALWHYHGLSSEHVTRVTSSWFAH